MASKKKPTPMQGGSFDKVEAETNRLRDELGGRLTEWLRLETSRIEQRVDLKVDGLERELFAKLDTKPSIAAMIINTVIGIGIIIAILAFGGDRFDGGMSASGAYAHETVERERRDAELDRQLTDIQAQLEAIRNEPQPKR